MLDDHLDECQPDDAICPHDHRDLGDLGGDVGAEDLVLTYATYALGEAPREFWPTALHPRAWAVCRLCQREPISTNFVTLSHHMQFRFLGERCRRRLLTCSDELEDLLRIPRRHFLDLFFAQRNLETEEEQRHARQQQQQQRRHATGMPRHL